jgi:hypothetical protein
LRQLPVLRWSVSCGLALGIVIAAWLAFGLGFSSGNLVPWVYMAAAVIGLLLFAGTVFIPAATFKRTV